MYKTENNTRSTFECNQEDTSYHWITPRGNQPIQLSNTQEEINWKHFNNLDK